MKQKPKAVFFDLDGTLSDSYGYRARMDHKTTNVLERYALKKMKQHQINSLEDALHLLQTNPILRLFQGYIQKRIDHKMRLYYQAIPLKKGAKVYLTYLHESGVQLALCTNNHRHLARLNLEQNGVLELFDLIVSGDEVTHSKPNPEMYQKALDYFDLQAHEVIVFEDMLAGIFAAKALDIRVIAVKDINYEQDEEEVEKLSEYQIVDFTDEICYQISA
ncbi:MAG: HAD family hydrolase [Erysipelotrichaceae bacterium]